MNNKKILLPAFILVALVQLYVPSKMILHREEILDTGKEYKFKTAPIDPTDPFRGKYITLRYDENMVEIQNEKDWVRGETIYVFLAKDSDGFAKIKSGSSPGGDPPGRFADESGKPGTFFSNTSKKPNLRL